MSNRATCSQPQCLLRDGPLARELAADWVIRLMAGETIDGAKELAIANQIQDQEACRQCALDVMREKKPIPTAEAVEEWESAEHGHRSYRRDRRARRKASA